MQKADNRFNLRVTMEVIGFVRNSHLLHLVPVNRSPPHTAAAFVLMKRHHIYSGM